MVVAALGQGKRCQHTAGHWPPWQCSIEALQTHAGQLWGLKDEWDSPCIQSVHGLAKQRPHAKLIILTNTLAQLLFYNVPSMGKSEEVTSAEMLMLLG